MKVMTVLNSLPIRFELNKGQVDERVRYLSRGSGYTLFLTPAECVFLFSRQEKPFGGSGREREGFPFALGRVKRAAVRLRFVGANKYPGLAGEGKLGCRTDYLIGNDPKKWQTDVPSYSRVRYEDIYPGVDVVYHGKGGRLEYDIVVSAGVDPSVVRLSFCGLTGIYLDHFGNLVLETPLGDMVHELPRVYQEVDGSIEELKAYYTLSHNGEVGFYLPEYDKHREVVIDPAVVLLYSTYLGGGNDDVGTGIAVDNNGHVYVTGYTFWLNFHDYAPNFSALSDRFSSNGSKFVPFIFREPFVTEISSNFSP